MPSVIGEFLTPQELHRLSRLVLQSRYVVEGNLAGAHRSPFRGVSAEFADHRSYIHGDDPKYLDWKILARTDRYYVKRYEDETNLRVYFVLDRSGSMGYGSGAVSKYAFASRLLAALGYVVVAARDSVGLFLHSDRIDHRAEARSTWLHLSHLLAVARETRPGSTTRMAAALHQIAESVRKRALVVILSDLLDEPGEVCRALAHFRKQHHDVIVFHVVDPAELDLPFPRGCEFVDMETGRSVSADPRAILGAYQTAFSEFLESYRKACAEMTIDYRLARVDQPLEPFVRAYLQERRRLSK